MHERYDRLIIIMFTVLSLGALLALRGFNSNYEFRYTFPQSEKDREQILLYQTLFPERQVLVVAVDDTGGYLADSVFETLRRIPGVSLAAPESIPIPRLSGGDLESWIAADRLSGADRVQSINEILDDDAFLSSLFRSADGLGRVLYLYDMDSDGPADFMDRVMSGIPGEMMASIQFWGGPYFNAVLRDRARRDTYLLIPLATLIVLLMHAWMARDLRTGLCLWTVSIIPALWALSLYPLTGSVFRNDSILVPIQILALSTSYAIQYFRHAINARQARGQGTGHSVIPIILMSGGTTILGFSSLCFIPITSVRSTAAFIISGILFALLSALLLLPTLLRKASILERQDPASINTLVLPQPRGIQIAIGLSALILLVSAGALSVQSRWSDDQLLHKGDQYSKAASYYNERFGGMEEIELIINGEEPYFFIETGHYQRLRDLGNSIRMDNNISIVLDAPSFLDWTFNGMNGVDTGASTMEEIGETLELAGGSGPGLSLSSLLAAEASVARIIIRFSPHGFGSYKDFETSLLTLAQEAFPDAISFCSGVMKDRMTLRKFLVNGMIMGILGFMPTLFLFFLFYFRSVGMATQAIIPPLAALGSYFGLAGWLGIDIDPILAVGAAAVMGVGVDDVIHLLLTARNGTRRGQNRAEAFVRAAETAGTSIVQTTFIIIMGLLILLFSVFISAAWTGLLSILSLSAATAVTLFVVPRLPFGLKDGKKENL